MNKRWIFTHILPIFLVVVLISGGTVAAVPQLRNKFVGFVSQFGPKADELTANSSTANAIGIRAEGPTENGITEYRLFLSGLKKSGNILGYKVEYQSGKDEPPVILQTHGFDSSSPRGSFTDNFLTYAIVYLPENYPKFYANFNSATGEYEEPLYLKKQGLYKVTPYSYYVDPATKKGQWIPGNTIEVTKGVLVEIDPDKLTIPGSNYSKVIVKTYPLETKVDINNTDYYVKLCQTDEFTLENVQACKDGKIPTVTWQGSKGTLVSKDGEIKLIAIAKNIGDIWIDAQLSDNQKQSSFAKLSITASDVTITTSTDPLEISANDTQTAKVSTEIKQAGEPVANEKINFSFSGVTANAKYALLENEKTFKPLGNFSANTDSSGKIDFWIKGINDGIITITAADSITGNSSNTTLSLVKAENNPITLEMDFCVQKNQAEIDNPKLKNIASSLNYQAEPLFGKITSDPIYQFDASPLTNILDKLSSSDKEECLPEPPSQFFGNDTIHTRIKVKNTNEANQYNTIDGLFDFPKNIVELQEDSISINEGTSKSKATFTTNPAYQGESNPNDTNSHYLLHVDYINPGEERFVDFKLKIKTDFASDRLSLVLQPKLDFHENIDGSKLEKEIARPELGTQIESVVRDGQTITDHKNIIYPGDTISFTTTINNPTNQTIQEGALATKINASKFAELKSYSDQGQVVDQEDGKIVLWHYDKINPGESYSKKITLKLSDEIPFDVTQIGLSSYLFDKTKQLRLSKKNEFDLYNQFSGKITGPYGHPVPEVSLNIIDPYNDYIINGYDYLAKDDDVSIQEEPLKESDTVITDNDGGFNVNINRNSDLFDLSRGVDPQIRLRVIYKNWLEGKPLLNFIKDSLGSMFFFIEGDLFGGKKMQKIGKEKSVYFDVLFTPSTGSKTDASVELGRDKNNPEIAYPAKGDADSYERVKVAAELYYQYHESWQQMQDLNFEFSRALNVNMMPTLSLKYLQGVGQEYDVDLLEIIRQQIENQLMASGENELAAVFGSLLIMDMYEDKVNDVLAKMPISFYTYPYQIIFTKPVWQLKNDFYPEIYLHEFAHHTVEMLYDRNDFWDMAVTPPQTISHDYPAGISFGTNQPDYNYPLNIPYFGYINDFTSDSLSEGLAEFLANYLENRIDKNNGTANWESLVRRSDAEVLYDLNSYVSFADQSRGSTSKPEHFSMASLLKYLTVGHETITTNETTNDIYLELSGGASSPRSLLSYQHGLYWLEGTKIDIESRNLGSEDIDQNVETLLKSLANNHPMNVKELHDDLTREGFLQTDSSNNLSLLDNLFLLFGVFYDNSGNNYRGLEYGNEKYTSGEQIGKAASTFENGSFLTPSILKYQGKVNFSDYLPSSLKKLLGKDFYVHQYGVPDSNQIPPRTYIKSRPWREAPPIPVTGSKVKFVSSNNKDDNESNQYHIKTRFIDPNSYSWKEPQNLTNLKDHPEFGRFNFEYDINSTTNISSATSIAELAENRYLYIPPRMYKTITTIDTFPSSGNPYVIDSDIWWALIHKELSADELNQVTTTPITRRIQGAICEDVGDDGYGSCGDDEASLSSPNKPLKEIEVNLSKFNPSSDSWSLVKTTFTDSYGIYLFFDIPDDGQYRVDVNKNSLPADTRQLTTDNEPYILDLDSSSYDSYGRVLIPNFGYKKGSPKSTLQVSLWHDIDGNGLFSNAEWNQKINNVRVSLYKWDSQKQVYSFISSLPTSQNICTFSDLETGYYYKIEADEEAVKQQLGFSSITETVMGQNSRYLYVNEGQNIYREKFGYKENEGAKISGMIWHDANRNGYYDSTEQENSIGAISNVSVRLQGKDQSGNDVSLEKVSDNQGHYSFDRLRAGNYEITIDRNDSDLQQELKQSNGGVLTKPTPPETSWRFYVNLTASIENADFGLAAKENNPVSAKIRGTIFNDKNYNGQQESGEEGIERMSVTYNYYKPGNGWGSGMSTQTKQDGGYEFTGLSTENRYYFSGLNASGIKNPDVNLRQFGSISTQFPPEFGLNTGEEKVINLGFGLGKGSVGGKIWFDENLNGQIDLNEGPIINETGQPEDVGLRLSGRTKTGEYINQTVYTDITGNFNFGFVPDSINGQSYTINVMDYTLPETLKKKIYFTTPTISRTFALNGAVKITGKNIGYGIYDGKIGGRVWLDDNWNGLNDDGANKNLAGISVRLYGNSKTGQWIYKLATTDNNGVYNAVNLPPGQYQVELQRWSLPAEYQKIQITNGAEVRYPDPSNSQNNTFSIGEDFGLSMGINSKIQNNEKDSLSVKFDHLLTVNFDGSDGVKTITPEEQKLRDDYKKQAETIQEELQTKKQNEVGRNEQRCRAETNDIISKFEKLATNTEGPRGMLVNSQDVIVSDPDHDGQTDQVNLNNPGEDEHLSALDQQKQMLIKSTEINCHQQVHQIQNRYGLELEQKMQTLYNQLFFNNKNLINNSMQASRDNVQQEQFAPIKENIQEMNQAEDERALINKKYTDGVIAILAKYQKIADANKGRLSWQDQEKLLAEIKENELARMKAFSDYENKQGSGKTFQQTVSEMMPQLQSFLDSFKNKTLDTYSNISNSISRFFSPPPQNPQKNQATQTQQPTNQPPKENLINQLKDGVQNFFSDVKDFFIPPLSVKENISWNLLGRVSAIETQEASQSKIIITDKSAPQTILSEVVTGQDVVVSGDGFTNTKKIQLYFDNQFILETGILGDGFVLDFKIPISAKKGEHKITLLGNGSEEEAVSTIIVTNTNPATTRNAWILGIAVLLIISLFSWMYYKKGCHRL